MVSKGFLIFAQNTDSVDYVQQAYALSLSIKATQKDIKNVSLVTNSSVPEEYKTVFDQIIPIPWFEETVSGPLAAEHRWKLYHITPYNETIVLDADMLMLRDVSDWWWYAQDHDLLFCTKTLNYKGDSIDDSIYRKTFTVNQLPNTHHALHYFKKSETAEYFYKTLEFVVNNWAWCYGKFAPEHYQNWLSMDLASAIALEMTGYNTSADACSPLRFVHMKPGVQDWHPVPMYWSETIPYIYTKSGELIVGNIKQHHLFHYVEKDFVKDENIISKLKSMIDGN
jgi:hypothetical protein